MIGNLMNNSGMDEQEKAEGITPEAARIFQNEGEETQQPPVSFSTQQETQKKPARIGTVLFVVILFGLGVWLSVQLRSFFAPAETEPEPVHVVTPYPLSDTNQRDTEASPSVRPTIRLASEWETYQVRGNGTAFTGVTYTLPSNVSAPVCDGTSCVSQGTNLPGGTRFTVAARGKGQALPDFRGAILTDANGKEFAMEEMTIGAITGYGYEGSFTGKTGGGYMFSRMRGILIPIDDSLAVDFNHFAPVGVTTDFESDDRIFEQIITSFVSGLSK